MELRIQKKELLRVLSKCAAVADKKGTMPILANVALKTEGAALKLAATDLVLGVQAEVPCEVKQPGGCCVSAKDLLDRANVMPDGELSLQLKDAQLTVKAGKGSRTFRLHTMELTEFPELPSPEGGSSFALEAGVLREVLGRVQSCISEDISRPALASALLERRDGELRVVGCDGHRLALVKLTGEDLKSGASLLVPLKGVVESRRLCGEVASDAEVKICSSGVNCFFEVGAFLLSVKLVDGQFPPYEQVIPKNLTRQAIIERAPLVDSVKAVAISASSQSRGIRLAFGDGELRISSESAEAGDGFDSLEFTVGEDENPDTPKGRIAELGLSSTYLLDALTAIATERASVRFGAALDPMLLEEHNGPSDMSFLGVVMPMRI